MRALALLFVASFSTIAGASEDVRPAAVDPRAAQFPVDQRCRGLLVAESYGLGRTVGLAQLAERRRAWLLQEFFGEGQIFRSAAYQWVLAATYLNKEDIGNARYDTQNAGKHVFDPRLGVQPARRYHDALITAAPASAQQVVWKELTTIFEGTFLVNNITTPGQAGLAVNELARRLELTGLSQAEFLLACRQLRAIVTDATLTADIQALLQETLPAYAPAGLRHHHARLIRRAGDTKYAAAVDTEGAAFERRFLEGLQKPFGVDLRTLVEEVILVTPSAPYPRYEPQLDVIDELRSMTDQEQWMAIFQASGREASERVRWLVTPSLWEEVGQWAKVAPASRFRSRSAAPELETVQAITRGMAVLPPLRERLALLAEDLTALRQDVERLIVTGRLALGEAQPSDGVAAFHQLEMAVEGAETLRLGLVARDHQVTKWRDTLSRAHTALVAASAASDDRLLEEARRQVRETMPRSQ